MTPIAYVRTQRDLDDWVKRLAAAGRFGFDTEFHRERTYRPRLCLVQVSLPDACALIDPFANLDLTGFFRLVADPGAIQVVHAGLQDLEIVYGATGNIPRGTFDTQIAAAFAGHGDSIGFANLVEAALGVRIEKGETLSDWTRRPLSDEQIEYAANDVRYLLPLHDYLTNRLSKLGRLAWLDEEFRKLEDPEMFEYDPERCYRRYRGAWHLSRRALAVLRELAIWREDEARETDEPRGRIAKDESLVGLARRVPRSVRDVRGGRWLHPSVAERSAGAIVAAVERGLAIPESELPQGAPGPDSDPFRAAQVEFLSSYVRSVAQELGIGSGTLASREGLLDLVATRPSSSEEILRRPAFSGWRGQILAEALHRLLARRAALALAPIGEGRPRGALVLVATE